MSRPRKLADHIGVTTKIPREQVLELRRIALDRSNGESVVAADLIRQAVAEWLARQRDGAREGLERFAMRGLAAQTAVDGVLATVTPPAGKPASKSAPKRRARR